MNRTGAALALPSVCDFKTQIRKDKMLGPWPNPFLENQFMMTALVACCLICVSAAPLGVFLSFKRMSLTADALGHALLPGAALGFMIAGLSATAMNLGGLLTGLLLAFMTSWMSFHKRTTADSNLAALYLISLSLGVVLVSVKGSQIDLLHFLFGNILAIDPLSLSLLAGIVVFSVLLFLLILKPLLSQIVDPTWSLFRRLSLKKLEFLFLFLVVLNLVISFQVLGTLMSVGLMILPGLTARLWFSSLRNVLLVSILIGIICSALGLYFSFVANTPTGPTIILTLGVLYLVSFVMVRKNL